MFKQLKYQIFATSLFLLMLLIAPKIQGQVYDSVFYPPDSTAVMYFYNRLNTAMPLQLHALDTTLKDFEAYNPLDTAYLFYASLGNVGLAYRSLNFDPKWNMGFDYGIKTFDTYLIQPENIKFYLNAKPYTEIGYVTGKNKEQLFQARHQQRVYRRLAVGVDFSLINSLGTYQRHKSDNYRLAATTQFFTSNLRYGFIGSYYNARVKPRENGGIVYDSVYEQDLEPNRAIIEINLANAENLVRRSGIYFQQYFQLSRKQKTALPDSLQPERKKLQFRFGRIAHAFHYQNNSMVYTDLQPDLNYYPNTYYDSISTYDSVYFRKIDNTFSWSNVDYINRLTPQPLMVEFGIRHQVAEVRDSIRTSEFQNLMPYGQIRIAPHPFITVNGKAEIILSDDDYSGDYHLFARTRIAILRSKPYKTTFNFVFDLAGNSAPYFYRHYFSNHFQWDNNFPKIETNKLSAFVTQRRTQLGVDVIQTNNYLYLDEAIQPAQLGRSTEVLKAFLHQQFVVGKVDFETRLLYQKASDPDIIRLPEFMGYLTLSFNLDFFKGALRTRSGFDIYYFTKYYADAYQPAIRSFYLQNEKEVGEYLHADFFLNFNVARTRFFMKLQNILSAVGPNNYYQVPHYPLQDMTFKFGLSWRFHD
jgi:hypothetical protein